MENGSNCHTRILLAVNTWNGEWMELSHTYTGHSPKINERVYVVIHYDGVGTEKSHIQCL